MSFYPLHCFSVPDMYTTGKCPSEVGLLPSLFPPEPDYPMLITDQLVTDKVDCSSDTKIKYKYYKYAGLYFLNGV